MFTFEVIATVASVTITTFVLSLLFLTREMSRMAVAIMRVGRAGGAYCVVAGLYLLTGWPDPLASHAVGEQGSPLAPGSRLGPLVLAAFGAYMVYLFSGALQNAKGQQPM